jgi:hypothetical protein
MENYVGTNDDSSNSTDEEEGQEDCDAHSI